MAPSAFVRKERGFTLIELMIAVAIVGLLAAIAYPSYTQYVRRGKIVEGLGELAALRVRLEQYYQDNRDYGSSASGCGVPMPSQPSFTFSCTWGLGATSQSFVATATGQASGHGWLCFHRERLQCAGNDPVRGRSDHRQLLAEEDG